VVHRESVSSSALIDAAATKYLASIRRLRSSGHATEELSFYAPLNVFLSELLEGSRPHRFALSHPQGIDGDFPDVGIYEASSNMLVLPFEVKGAGANVENLATSGQAQRYAKSFGGGRVMVTNLYQFALARLDGSSLVIEDQVDLLEDETHLDRSRNDLGNRPRDLAALIEQGCQVRGTLADPKVVANFLAYHARGMRDSINGSGDPLVLLAPIRQAFSEGLQIDLAVDLLVPTVVQTLVYGLFAAWLDDPNPSEFDWMEAAYHLGVPVFADVLYAALRPALLRRCNLKQHLDNVARVLMWVDRDAFVGRFDGGAIEYFYEPFLAEFDAELRDKLGVWYTPREIADYQVARADRHLKDDLGIAAGIADPSVYILDPACGTGTYLAAVLRHIYSTNLGNNEMESVAVGRVRDAAVSRVIGFEILPAAFIICHLHLQRMLRQLGVESMGDERLRVHLTNSLTGWDETSAPVGTTLFPELEEELQDAGRVKHHERVLVILGNPPYQGYSSAETDEEKELLRPWIQPLWPVWGLRKHRMNDLYVRFWRVAIEKIATMTDRGVISFITNRKWIGGRSYPTMREAVMTNFHKVVVDDLHGAVDDTSHPGDQSIFTTAVASGITRGTAIVTAVRTGPMDTKDRAEVEVRDFWGSATSKRNSLENLSQADTGEGLAPIVTSASLRWRFASDANGDYPSVDEYLPTYVSGVQLVHDEVVLSFDKQSLERRMKDYFDPDLSFQELLERHPEFGLKADAERSRLQLLDRSAYRPERLVRFLFRPFDVRWLYWEPDRRLLHRARPELQPYWLALPDQRCLVLPQTPRRVGAFRPTSSVAVASFACAEPDARVFPLHGLSEGFHGVGHQLGSADVEIAAKTNVAPEWIQAVRDLGGSGDDLAIGDSVFFSLLSIMNAPSWLAAQTVDADDFPSVPLPGDLTAFESSVELGSRLASLLDPLVEVAGVTEGSIESAWSNIGIPDDVAGDVELAFGRFGVAGGKREDDAVLWGEHAGWRNIPDEIWTFTVGGHAVLAKWLSYRKNVGLSRADREQFMLTCRRIAAIRRLEEECDKAYKSSLDNPLRESTGVLDGQ
jgi:hypothetical protein